MLSGLSIADPTIHDFACKVSGKISQAHRPQNSPERRLLGMFHHLRRIANDGLLKRWLVFRNLSVFSEEKELRRQALTGTELLFYTPDWEIWRKHLVLGKSKQINTSQLAGKDRQTVIWANAVLPFFLALARHENEPKLEKTS